MYLDPQHWSDHHIAIFFFLFAQGGEAQVQSVRGGGGGGKQRRAD